MATDSLWATGQRNPVDGIVSSSLFGYIHELRFSEALSPPIRQNQCISQEMETEERKRELALQCAMALCGPPKDTGSAWVTDFNFDHHLPANVPDRFPEVENEIREIVDLTLQDTNAFIEAVKAKLADNPQALVPNFDEWSDGDFGRFYNDLFAHHIDFDVDKTKPLEERLTYTLDIPEDATENFRKALEIHAQEDQKNMYNSPNSLFASNLHTKEENLGTFK